MATCDEKLETHKETIEDARDILLSIPEEERTFEAYNRYFEALQHANNELHDINEEPILMPKKACED